MGICWAGSFLCVLVLRLGWGESGLGWCWAGAGWCWCLLGWCWAWSGVGVWRVLHAQHASDRRPPLPHWTTVRGWEGSHKRGRVCERCEGEQWAMLRGWMGKSRVAHTPDAQTYDLTQTPTRHTFVRLSFKLPCRPSCPFCVDAPHLCPKINAFSLHASCTTK